MRIAASPPSTMTVKSLDPQHLDARQRLAFKPFEEGAAGGRHIGEPVGDARGIERGHRIAAAGDRDKLAGARQFRGRFRRLRRCRCRTARFRRRRTARSRPASSPAPAPKQRARRCAGRCRGSCRSCRHDRRRRRARRRSASNFSATTASTGSTISRRPSWPRP